MPQGFPLTEHLTSVEFFATPLFSSRHREVFTCLKAFIGETATGHEGKRVGLTSSSRNSRSAKQKRSQAERIIEKFGGARRLARILKETDPKNSLTPSSIYRWLYPKEKGGTGGKVPTQSLETVMRAARFEGILLTTEDLFPGDI